MTVVCRQSGRSNVDARGDGGLNTKLFPFKILIYINLLAIVEQVLHVYKCKHIEPIHACKMASMNGSKTRCVGGGCQVKEEKKESFINYHTRC